MILITRGDLTFTGLLCDDCDFPLARVLRRRGFHFSCGTGEDFNLTGWARSSTPSLEWLQMHFYVSPITVEL